MFDAYFRMTRPRTYKMNDEWNLLDEIFVLWMVNIAKIGMITDVLAKLQPDFDELLESKNWIERRDALQSLLSEIEKTPRLDPKVDYFNITQRLRNILSKDANINVCAVAAKCITAIAKGLRTKFAQFVTLYMPVIFERFKEKRSVLRDPLINCIDAIALTVNLDTLAEDLPGYFNKPNPHIKIQGCNFIYRVMKNYNQNSSPKKVIKSVTPVLVKFTADPDADVRDAACTALGSIMRITGDKVMYTFLGSLQEDKTKMKKISDGRDQAIAEYDEVASVKNETVPNGLIVPNNNSSPLNEDVVTGIEAKASEIDLWDTLDAVDVLSKLPNDFMEKIESKKWQERMDGLQSLLALCPKNTKLCPKASYGEYVDVIKKILEKDANINVCASAARCLTVLAAGLRKKFAPFATVVASTIFEKFKEKKPVLRDPLIDCIDAVAASTTLDALTGDIQAALNKQNPHIKIQTSLFLYREFKRHNSSSILKKVLKSLFPVMTKQTYDSDPEVRQASFAALGAAMKAIGEKPCMILLADIAEDKTKIEKIRGFYQKAVQEAGTDVVSIMVQSMHKSNPLKPPAPGVGNSNPDGNISVKEVNEEERVSEEITRPKDEFLVINKDKGARLRDERNLRILKWNFDQPDAEHVDQLKTLLSSVTQASLLTLLFNKDFKLQLKGIDILQSLVTDCPESLITNSDLILKWISLRFFETNPTVLLKVLDLTQAIFNLLLQHKEPFSDQELCSFIPYLILKLGEPKDSVRTPVRTIIQLMTELVTPPKIFPLILDGLKTKNSRQRMECLQVLEQLLDTTGIRATATPSQSLKQIAACISDRDTNVRNAAINAIVVAWKEEGDRVFQLIGKMSEKNKTMLDERIKRSGMVSRVRGRGVRNDRSLSRAGRTTYRSASISRDSSPAEDKEKNRTYILPEEHTADKNEVGETRKRFTLNFDILKLDDDEGLLEFPELGSDKLEMLHPIEPVVFPRKHPSKYTNRAGSVSSLASIESLTSDVDKVIHNMASMSPTTAASAISQLQFLFGDPNNFRYVADRTDAIVHAIVTQSSIIRSRHLNDMSRLTELNELVRTICHFLSSLLKESTTCSRMSTESLKILIQEFLYLLKDERMNQLKDIHSIIRSLNYLSIRLCDNADLTACFLALCSMLTSALHDPRNQTVPLIVKCLYKQSQNFERNVKLDLDAIVKAVHAVMQEFQPRVEESENIKISMHAIQLCIQRLIANSSIIQHIGVIPNPESSEAIIYINKCIRKLESNPNALAFSAFEELPGEVMSSNYEESIRNFITMIVEHPVGKGLRLLHTFLKVNPDGQKFLETELKKYSRTKDFITFHLKKMDHGNRETPEVTDELYNVMESIREHREALRSYRQTGWWTGYNVSSPPTSSAEENNRTVSSRRSFQRPLTEGAPENDSALTLISKPKFTASDVEPLRQLLNMRRQQQ
ncbi:unnamed protein product [Thelazia callipaeda]|uniref:Cytoskeleton-associated protein 5 n=1 Tax=Thelazia callipaeda TaxID=103827 RepID=A0A158RD59_THECL|nr:unnamed protein product [Thelazia callipaeda]